MFGSIDNFDIQTNASWYVVNKMESDEEESDD